MSRLKSSVTVIFILVCFSSLAYAQKQYMDTIEVGSSVNTYLRIKGMDIKNINIAGSNNVAFQNSNGVVMFMAKQANFQPTNMLVIAPDTVLQFYLRYNASPKKTLYQYNLKKNTSNVFISGAQEATPGEEGSESKLRLSYNPTSFQLLKGAKPNLNAGLIRNKILFRVTTIAADHENIYFVITVMNNTPINYPIDYVNFEVRSRKSLRASGQQSVYPQYVSSPDNVKIANPHQSIKLMYGLTKFALREDEILTITIFEKAVTSKGRQYKIDLNSNDFNAITNL